MPIDLVAPKINVHNKVAHRQIKKNSKHDCFKLTNVFLVGSTEFYLKILRLSCCIILLVYIR